MYAANRMGASSMRGLRRISRSVSNRSGGFTVWIIKQADPSPTRPAHNPERTQGLEQRAFGGHPPQIQRIWGGVILLLLRLLREYAPASPFLTPASVDRPPRSPARSRCGSLPSQDNTGPLQRSRPAM